RVVAVRHDHDRVGVLRAGREQDVAEQHRPPPRDRRVEAVDLRLVPVELHLRDQPAARSERAGRSGRAVRVEPRQLLRERDRDPAVELRLELRLRERGGTLDAEGGDQEREPDEEPGAAVQTAVDRALGRATAESATILLVDDEESVQKLLTYPPERDGYRVVQARDGDEALARFDEQKVDLVVLDVMLPRVDGLEVCKRLRTRSAVPIVMLTARGDELDKVLGLELGADDYITKPFSIREFRSPVRALLRRASAPKYEPRDEEVLEVDGLRIDPARRSVEVDGRPVQLTYVEFELLRALARRP